MSRGRLALWWGLPLAILLVGQMRACRIAGEARGDPRPQLEAEAARLTRGLDALVEQARAAALRTRDESPEAARKGLAGVLADRLEGAGVVRRGLFESWIGTPAAPPRSGAPGETVLLASRGIRDSLVVLSAPDAAGRSGVVTFVLEIRSGGVSAADLLDPQAPGISARWDFAPAPDLPADRYDAGPPATLRRPWLAAGGASPTVLVLEHQPAATLAHRARARTLAWASAAFAVLALVALARRPGPVDVRRLAIVAGTVAAARGALVAGRVFEELLPRSLGAPSLYGRGEGLGLLSSPAALAATALAVYLLATTASRWAERACSRGHRWALALLAAIAAAGVASSVALAASLARDARVPVPRLDPASAGALLLTLAAALVLTGTAEALAAFGGAVLRRDSGTGVTGRLAVAAALVPLSLIAIAELHGTTDHMIDDRLRSEFAPLVRDQSARRRLALISAVGESAASPAVATALARDVSRDDPYFAYELWTASDLFHQGFASSLDVYDAAGARRGHFAFAFPQVGGARESVARLEPAGAPPVTEFETVPVGATLLRVVHAESAVRGANGEVVGRVVGHVLEDPSNLPFLPGSAPYLEALGRGPSRFEEPSGEAPDYVLFDEEGRVAVSTVVQPPAPSPLLRAAAREGRRIDVDAGDTRFRALALEDGPRLHVLMTPAPTPLDAAGDTVRLLLAGLAVLAVSAVARTLSGPLGLATFADVVRGSFRRKLLAAVLVASVVPLVGLAVFLRAYIERRSEATLADSAAAVVGAAQRVVEDYQSVGEDDPAALPLRINDEALSWLRRVVGQEIHVYEAGEVAATSKPELFDSGLVSTRLPGEVDRAVVRGGQPFLVRTERLGDIPLPVAYARVDVRGGPPDAVIAVPLVLEQRAFVRSVDRLVEMLLLLTTALVGTLAATAALVARSVAGPVKRLADASRRIASGRYDAPLVSTSRDEMGSLVRDFNRMARALADQRADLERRRDYIEALLRHATTGVVSTDADGRIVTINPAAEALLAGPDGPPRRGEPFGRELDRTPSLAALARAVVREGTTGAPVEIDLGGDETPARLRLVRVPLPDPAGGAPGTLVLLDDVTSLMKSNQLAAWAEMARAIAHEIKNPLTPIQLSAEHVRRLLADRGVLPSPEIEACIDSIVRQVRELREISSAFSTYARIPDLTVERVDPAAFLRDVVAPYRAAPPPGIRIEEHLPALPAILADRRILARAVVNLVENALQAMPHGGRLRIAAAATPGGLVAIEVGDGGPGLSPEVRARLFEPYFSTKSSGTGLGLAIARRVVEAHGGTIEVESAPGRGTTFRILLAAATAP